jgi:hypothetical protein
VASIGIEAQEFLTNFSTAKFLGSHKIETRRDLQIYILAGRGRSLLLHDRVFEAKMTTKPFRYKSCLASLLRSFVGFAAQFWS